MYCACSAMNNTAMHAAMIRTAGVRDAVPDLNLVSIAWMPFKK
jgi:hypothetical protein